jgi:YaiO family outer membrane protein
MEQVRPKRAEGGSRRRVPMMRRSWSIRLALVALVPLCAVADVASAQRATTSGTDVDAIVASALSLRRQNRRPEAAAAMRRAVTLAPGRADVRWWRDLLEHEVHGTEAMVGMNERTWGRQLAEWREAQLSLRQNTTVGPLVARVSHVERGALRDDRLEVEAYPAFRGGYAAIGAGFARDATVYARTTVMGEVFKSLSERIEASVGYRRLNFDDPVDVLTGSLGAYHRDFLIGMRVSHVTQGGTSVVASTRRYLADDGQYVGLFAGTGTVPVLMLTPPDFETRSSREVGAEALFIIRSRWVLTGRASIGREGLLAGGTTTVSSVQVGTGLRF